MKVAFYLAEGLLVLATAAGMAWGASQASEWLTANLLHPLAVAFPVGLLAGMCRDRHPLLTLEHWHGVAVRRLDGRG